MYPDEFDYHRPGTLDEALTLLDRPRTQVLAGGHGLIPLMKAREASPTALVDIEGLDDLRGIDRQEGGTWIGALTRYATLHTNERLWEDTPVIAEAAGEVGDVQVRNRGTIGGNLAHADPASDLPAAALAADATVTVRGSNGEREIPADDLFVGPYSTDIGNNEIVTGVHVPHHGTDGGAAYVKRVNPSSGYAMVGVAVVLRIHDGVVRSARIAANGVMDHTVRLSSAEEALQDVQVDEAVTEATQRASDNLSRSRMRTDAHASAEFRENLLRIYTERAVTTAVERYK